MNQRYKDPEQKQEGPIALDLDIPKVDDLLSDLDKILQDRERIAKEHVALMEKEDEDEKKGKGKKKQRQKPKGGMICFCGNPMCRIGEFVQMEGGQ